MGKLGRCGDDLRIDWGLMGNPQNFVYGVCGIGVSIVRNRVQDAV